MTRPADELRQNAERLSREVVPPLEQLAAAAHQLNQAELAARLQQKRDQLLVDTFNLMVVGRFKNGKSTFLNALLGRLLRPVPELGDSSGPLPMDDLPCTATLTQINYGEQARVRAWDFAGHAQHWTLAEYLQQATVRADPEETRRFFQNIRQFELDYPAEFCQAGVTLWDSPGTDDDPRRTAITREAINRCDAAFVLFRSDILAGESERVFVNASLIAEGLTHYFMIVNLYMGRKVDDRFKAFVWNRLIHEMLGGEKYNGQDFAERDIYFVDCLAALEGVRTGNQELIRSSGLETLEQRLVQFLEGDRRKIHLERHLRPAERFAQELESATQRLMAGMAKEQQEFEANLRAVTPQLQEIQNRRRRLPRIIERYRHEAEYELLRSFDHFVEQLPALLLDGMEKQTLPSLSASGGLEQLWQRTRLPLIEKRVGTEAAQALSELLTTALQQWQQTEISRSLEPVLERMMQEIGEEVSSIEQQVEEIGFTLTGWRPEVATLRQPQTSTVERAAWVVGGLLTSNWDLALLGGTLGWKGAARGFAVEVVGLTTLILAGVAAPVAVPVAIGAAFLTNILSGAANAEKKVHQIKEKTVQIALYGDPQQNRPGLRTLLESAKPLLSQELQKKFDELSQAIAASVESIITAQEQEINQMVEVNRRSAAEKQLLLRRASEQLATIQAQRQQLQDALLTMRQL